MSSMWRSWQYLLDAPTQATANGGAPSGLLQPPAGPSAPSGPASISTGPAPLHPEARAAAAAADALAAPDGGAPSSSGVNTGEGSGAPGAEQTNGHASVRAPQRVLHAAGILLLLSSRFCMLRAISGCSRLFVHGFILGWHGLRDALWLSCGPAERGKGCVPDQAPAQRGAPKGMKRRMLQPPAGAGSWQSKRPRCGLCESFPQPGAPLDYPSPEQPHSD